MRRFIIPVLLLGLLFLTIIINPFNLKSSSHATIEAVSLNRLASNAPAIAIATVKEISDPYAIPPIKEVRDVYLEVENFIVNDLNLPSQISVIAPENWVKFLENERVIVFIEKRQFGIEKLPKLTTMGYSQGKFKIKGNIATNGRDSLNINELVNYVKQQRLPK